MSTVADPPKTLDHEPMPVLSAVLPNHNDYDRDHYEVVDGLRVETAPMGLFQAMIANFLAKQLMLFDPRDELGRVAIETLFHLKLADGDRRRRPDIAFVSYDRWPLDKPIDEDAEAGDVVPDLAIEVISPSNSAYELVTKLREYFESGVRMVWVIYPNVREIHIYDSPTSSRILKGDDVLDGGAVLPGFRLPLKTIFLDQ